MLQSAVTAIVMAAIIAALIALCIFVSGARESAIKDRVAALGGEFISCEPRMLKHPFILVSKGEQVYQFTYRQSGEVREAFVKFGLLDDWRLPDQGAAAKEMP